MEKLDFLMITECLAHILAEDICENLTQLNIRDHTLIEGNSKWYSGGSQWSQLGLLVLRTGWAGSSRDEWTHSKMHKWNCSIRTTLDISSNSRGSIYIYHEMSSPYSCAVWWSHAEQWKKREDILNKQTDDTFSRMCGLSGLAWLLKPVYGSVWGVELSA